MVAPAPGINVRAECLRPCHTNPFGMVGWPAAVSLALAASIALAKCFRSELRVEHCPQLRVRGQEARECLLWSWACRARARCPG